MRNESKILERIYEHINKTCFWFGSDNNTTVTQLNTCLLKFPNIKDSFVLITQIQI